MKKLISIALAAIMVMSVFALTACGGGDSKDYSDSKYVGVWAPSSVSVAGESGEMEDDSLMVVNADGTGTLTSGDEVSNFTWEPTDSGFKTKGDVKATFKDDGDNIKADMFGIELIFVRQ